MSEAAHDGVSMEPAVEGGEDRISALPDDVLRHLMAFLPSRGAVQTCVLARRWRTLWKSVPVLRVHDPESYDGVTGSSTFVYNLLRLRGPTPLHSCEIISHCEEMVDCDPDWDNNAFEHMEPWLQYAVLCQVQELTVYFPLRLTDKTFISSHLKRLEFHRMRFERSSLILLSCQVLQVLHISRSEICTGIFSASLKNLYIDDSTFDWDTRTYILAPNLVDFRLDVRGGWTPVILSMWSLATASVTLGECCMDCCYCGNHSCEGCHGHGKAGDNDINRSIVLEGLSFAENLQLEIYQPNVFLFRKDLKWCPMFSKVKTLLLNEWCVVNDFTGLVYFLQHAPILETLTLQLDFTYQEKQHAIETDESCNSSEQSLLSKHLKAVKIICDTKEDARVHQILKILRTYGVPSEQIDIQ